jgi:translation initiation factor IF-2
MDVAFSPEIKNMAKKENISVSSHRIIYSVLDEIKELLIKNSPVKIKYVTTGSGTIKSVF